VVRIQGGGRKFPKKTGNRRYRFSNERGKTSTAEKRWTGSRIVDIKVRIGWKSGGKVREKADLSDWNGDLVD
jgi:hypothetical protein